MNSSTFPTHSRAAVFSAANKPLELQSIPIATSKANMLVRVRCCTICGSDLHTIRGTRPQAGPAILGHEIVGDVVRLPEPPIDDWRGDRISVGDRITWSIVVGCGRCFFCTNELPQKCEHLRKYGHEPITVDPPLMGGLSEYCQLLPQTPILRLPKTLRDLVACPANCATATSAAALRQSGGCAGKTVLVFGAGMLGVTVTAMAKDQGAGCIAVVDSRADRLTLAKRFGATHCFRPDQANKMRGEVDSLSDGRGIDVLFEMSGATDAVAASLELARTGGKVILVGSVFPSRAISVDPERIVRKSITIVGVHNYAPPDLLAAVDFLARQDQSLFERVADQRYPLSQINDAVEKALSGTALRVAVVPDE